MNFGSFWGLSNRCMDLGAPLEASWESLGAVLFSPWADLPAFWEFFEAVLSLSGSWSALGGVLGAFCGRLVAVLTGSWGVWEACRGRLGGGLEASQGRLGVSSAVFWRHASVLGATWRYIVSGF